MNKSDWYEDRILWRAKRHRLDDFHWQVFETSHPTESEDVSCHLRGCGKPLFVFWRDSEQWTVLTNTTLVGKYRGLLSVVDLDSVGKISTVNDTAIPANAFKKYAELLRVGANGAIFWSPPAPVYFSLWNILQRFPLNVPS